METVSPKLKRRFKWMLLGAKQSSLEPSKLFEAEGSPL